MSDASLVLLKRFDNFMDANILKSKLESEGIMCFLFDENIITLDPTLVNAIGGIRLMVNRNDGQKAYQILVSLQSLETKKEDGTDIICPKCGSTNLYSKFKSIKSGKSLLAWVLSLLSFAYPLHYETVYRCKDCDHEFQKS